MPETKFLPPYTAVRMVWALTGSFSNDEHSKLSADLTTETLKDIKEKAQKIPKENEYITSAVANMEASLRSLDTIYKGRQLNFEENEKLRSTYLDSVKESLQFGEKAKDFLKSLPTMTITTAGGVIGIQALFGLPDLYLWGVGLLLAAAGYCINLLVVTIARGRTQKLYIKQDYERSLYYEQYITRTKMILMSLYKDINRLHKNIFGKPYPVDAGKEKEIIEDLMCGVNTAFCPYVHKHMKEGIITPELWAQCESGVPDVINECDYFKKEKNK